MYDGENVHLQNNIAERQILHVTVTLYIIQFSNQLNKTGLSAIISPTYQK